MSECLLEKLWAGWGRLLGLTDVSTLANRAGFACAAILNIWGKNTLSSTEIGERRDRIKKIIHPTLAPKALQAYLAGMTKDVDAWMQVNLGNLPADGVVRVYQVVVRS